MAGGPNLDEGESFGAAEPESAETKRKWLDFRSPKLQDTLDADGKTVVRKGAYTLAVEAKGRGEPYIFLDIPAAGRAFAPYVVAFGCRGTVVKRFRQPVSPDGASSGRVFADSGPISRLTVRFQVVEVLLAYKRWFLDRTTPRKQLRQNVFRVRPRNFTVR